MACFFCRNRVRVVVCLSDSSYKITDRFEFVSLNCIPMDKVVSVLPHLHGVIAEASDHWACPLVARVCAGRKSLGIVELPSGPPHEGEMAAIDLVPPYVGLLNKSGVNRESKGIC